jgi:serine/threonine protein kinase/Flp pilus assembly protein TadD
MAEIAVGNQPPVITTGSNIGRYQLVERIGAGGMGEVWKAHDNNLDRDVAIKFLLRETEYDGRNERFRREALALSRLSHPGVATVYDFDVHKDQEYLVMEYVGGGSLESRIANGPLAIDNVLSIGAALADAIDHAHQNGILHRDLKPGNIVFTAGGQPKILDFGLALLLEDASTVGRVTQPGMIMGSLGYMAPEQLFGEADARTDTYALGAMLFEMTTGQRPFVRDRTEALMFAIINTAPPRVVWHRSDAPEALDRIIAECLRKEPNERPVSAAVVAQTLRGISQGMPTSALPLQSKNAVRSIAVLPLRNVSKDPAQEYFADGMTESLISDLARVKALRVISHTSVARFKGATASIPEIARELNVDALLEGSALLIGNRVRLSVQLVSARTDETLWAERYDRELKDVLDMQSELARTVVKEIAIQLAPGEERKVPHGSVNPESYLEFLKARHSFSDASPQALEVGMRHARRAVELDPRSALAWTAVADQHMFRAIRGMTAPSQSVAEAMHAAQQALDLDPTLPDAHVSMGTILSHSGDVAGGLRHLRKAVELNPGLAHAQNLLGRALYSYERHEEALAAMSKSVTLDPQSMMIYVGVGDAYFFARDYEKSVVHYRLAIGLDPRFDGAHTGLGRSLEALGRFDEARAAYEKGIELASGVAGPSFGLAHLEITTGNEAEARRRLAELIEARATRVVSAWGIATLYASLGEADEAFRWLEAGIAEHAPGMILLRVHPWLDPIRGDPRYHDLVRRLGLDVIP